MRARLAKVESAGRRRASRASVLARVLLAALCVAPSRPAVFALAASVTVDASKVENRLSPLLYGQFMEFMFEGVKGGVHAELLRDRSFEEPPDAIGLPRYWERYPDDRGDDYALNFAGDEREAYPPKRDLKVDTGEP